jgi:glycosyltransferase involved in cell wall biosynthesis
LTGSLRIKLLYLINGLGPGGAERSLVEMLPFFRAAGIETTVVCLRDRKHNADAAVREQCSLRYLNARAMRGWVPELRRLVRELQPNLIHTTIFEADLAGRLAAAGTGVPVLTSIVNTAYDPVRLGDPNVRRWALLFSRELDGLTARRLTTHFHAITEAVKESAVRALRLRPERITVIPRGRDAGRLGSATPERKREARHRLGLDPEASIIVNVGRQEYQKGQSYLLEAMATVVGVHPRARLLIVGREGHATPGLQAKLAEHGLEGHVDFVGFRTDIPDFLAAADIFAFPSLYEGLGGAVIEAMALGLPVVASEIGPLREVVEHDGSGYLFAPGEPAELARRLISLIEHPETASRFGNRGRVLFEEKFTIARNAERMIELYRSIVGLKSPIASR